MIPKYAEVSEMMNIPESTLRSWFAQRESILTLQDTATAGLPTVTAAMISLEIPKLVASLAEEDYTQISMRDRINLLKTLISSQRLLTGQSTHNIAHAHYSPRPPAHLRQGKKGKEISVTK
jgi:hypothetical protein